MQKLDKNSIKLGVIGCGKMASAILGGIMNNKFLNSENIFVYDINNDSKNKLIQKYNFNNFPHKVSSQVCWLFI